MGVPFEAFLPYGIIVGMYVVTGVGLTATKYFSNEHKKARWNRDVWDKQKIYGSPEAGEASPRMQRLQKASNIATHGSWRRKLTREIYPPGCMVHCVRDMTFVIITSITIVFQSFFCTVLPSKTLVVNKFSPFTFILLYLKTDAGSSGFTASWNTDLDDGVVSYSSPGDLDSTTGNALDFEMDF